MNRIEDYGLIGDCHSLALVGRDGAVDWACFPRFDAPAVFCRMLDHRRGGCFLLAPLTPNPATRRSYVEDTNVLVTTFTQQGGALELTDCMPIIDSGDDNPSSVAARHRILRRARCTGGTVEVTAEVSPRFEYASFVPRFRLLTPWRGEVVGGSDSMQVESTLPMRSTGDTFGGNWTLRAGEDLWMSATWRPSADAPKWEELPQDRFESELAETIAFWRRWMSRCVYEGPHSAAVRRAALVLKALTYAPSGAVVAAGTTSLPESLGGERNWDYRFTWIRDATLTLTSLFILGFTDEAAAFKAWMERAGSGRPEDLQIMYGICGERRLPELVLSHLAGHRASAPVRVGNGAAQQSQLDSYGQLMQAAYLFHKAGGGLSNDNWQYLAGLADLAAEGWRRPDHGIWEMRDTPRHFVHSKAHCWLALDRAIRMAGSSGSRAGRWVSERAAVRDYLIEEAAPSGWFGQAVGEDTVDASALILPAIGLLPTSHPLVMRTIDVVRRDLERDGLVFRYLSPDGLPGDEGAFLLCSFWLLDCLIHANHLDAAESLLDQLLAAANDVGLYAEQVDPSTGGALGNFPQAFTHMALVASCSHLQAAKSGAVPFDGAYDYAELAVDRLLAGRGELASSGPPPPPLVPSPQTPGAVGH